jgi:hypothetical protein
VEESLKLLARSVAPSEISDEIRDSLQRGGWQGFLAKRLEQQARRAKNESPPTWLYASYYPGWGEKTRRSMGLEKSFDNGDIGNLLLKIDPLYDGLRDDPRDFRLLARIGLAP